MFSDTRVVKGMHSLQLAQAWWGSQISQDKAVLPQNGFHFPSFWTLELQITSCGKE
jgi:hypothetical protein